MNFTLNRLGIGTKLATGFGIVLGLMLLMSVLLLGNITTASRTVDLTVTQGIEHLSMAGDLMSANKDIAIAVRDVVSLESVSAQKESLKALRSSQKRFREELGRALKSAQGKDLAQLQATESRFKAIEPMIEEVVARVDESSFDEAKLFVFTKLRPKQIELSDGIHTYLQAQIEAANAGARSATESVAAARNTLLVISLIALLVGGTLAWRIGRNIVEPLHAASALAASVASGNLTERAAVTGSDELSGLMRSLNEMSETLERTVREIRTDADSTANSAGLLADSARNASELSQEQVDQVMSVSSAMEEMSESIRAVSGSAEGVNAVAKRASALSVDGSSSMTRNLQEMQSIVTHVEDSSRIISELSAAITQVSAITGVIKEIADQTNLLALNAAIEAARAGEAGRGFAVVADEVRKLAERTAHSTTEISSTLAHITAKASETVASMQRVRENVEVGSIESREVEAKLRQIVEAVGEVSSLVANIAAATSEQSRSAENTARSIETISSASEGTSRTIQEVGKTAREMHQVSQKLQQVVAKFRIHA